MNVNLKAILLASAMMVPASGALAADSMKMIMNWTADSAHLGFAVAQVNGLYEAADLDVELEEGRGSSVAAQLVATGQADVGFADAGAILNVASQGAPIKIISTIWKAGQFGIVSLKSENIQSPADLKGKKIAVAPGSAQATLLPVLLAKNGMTEADVEIVSSAQNAFLGLITSGAVDAAAETPENLVVPLKDEGYEASNMYFYEHGVPLVSLSLVAREDKLNANPDAYKRFLKATAEGWKQAMADPAAAVAALRKVFPEVSKSDDALMQGATYSFSSVCPAGTGDVIGVTDAAKWEDIYGVMTSAMGLTKDKPVTDYYTLDYVPAEPITCP